jgi:CRP-like cAMP-binding protein
MNQLEDNAQFKDLKRLIDFLSPISQESWKKVKSLFVEKALKKGEYFIKAGEYAKEMGFVYEGIIRAFYRNNEGDEYIKHFFISPTFCGGYSSLVNGLLNQINQEALTDCKILVANFADFKALYDTCHDVERVARVLAESYFAQKERRELELVLLNADKRYEIFQREYPGLEQKISQYHIASYLGITPTQLSRIRKKISGR